MTKPPHLSLQGPRVYPNSHFKQRDRNGDEGGVRPRSTVCHQDKAFVRGKVANVRGPSDSATGQWGHEGLLKEVPWGAPRAGCGPRGVRKPFVSAFWLDGASPRCSRSPVALECEAQAGKGRAWGLASAGDAGRQGEPVRLPEASAQRTQGLLQLTTLGQGPADRPRWEARLSLPADPGLEDASYQPQSPRCPLPRRPHHRPLLSSGAPQGPRLNDREAPNTLRPCRNPRCCRGQGHGDEATAGPSALVAPPHPKRRPAC